MKLEKEWMSISDMMTGLMMVFLFISVVYIEQSLKDVKHIDDVAKQYAIDKALIYESLYKEFHRDLKKWNADLIKDSLIIRFLSPQIMFNPAQSDIKPKFQTILSDFCPRYFRLLSRFSSIAEIRIEGHTSNEWKGLSKEKAYFKNMELSQGRTRSVLEYCVNIEKPESQIRNWTVKRLTANGLSSSQPLCSEDNVKCRALNRRVDFRVQINTESILNSLSKK